MMNFTPVFRSWKSRVALAAKLRKSSSTHMTALIVITLVVSAVWIGLSIVLVPGSEVPEFNFADERGAVTVLSALFLTTAASFSLVVWLVLGPDEPTAVRIFWFCAAAAIAFLALGELLQIHERVGGAMDDVTSGSGPFRNWNDVIVIFYGVGALAVGVYFLPVLLRYPLMLELLSAGFLMFIVHTVTDSISEPPTYLSHILEESAKLFTGAFLALAMLSGLLHIIPNKRRRTP